MKSIVKLFLSLSLLIFLFTSCNDDFLERIPEDKLSDITFWETGDELLMFANQFYPDLKNIQNVWYVDDNQSDNQVPFTRNTYTWGEYTVPSSGGGWGKSDWKSIRDINYALDKIANVDKSGDLDFLVGIGELKFFKAFYYFEKVKEFGKVPWFSHTLTTESEEALQAPRDSRELVIDSIIANLDYAIDHLPEASSDQRLTKYAALALKANVCLYEGTFRKYHDVVGNYNKLLELGAQACEEIMESGLFSLYSTGDPDNDLFNLYIQEDLRNNPEAILVQHFIPDVHMSNNTRRHKEPNTGFSLDFAKSFLCDDGLPISLSPEYQGDNNFKEQFKHRDPRMQQFMYNGKRPLLIRGEDSIYLDLPQIGRASGGALAFTGSITGYTIIRGYSPSAEQRQASNTTLDCFVYQYSYVLINYAEIKAELGECTQDVLDKTVNALRDRVAMPHLNVNVGFTDPNWPDWEVPVSPLINEIRRERRIVMAADGKRWDDLVRWKAGKLLENPETYMGARDPDNDYEYYEVYPGLSRKWDDKLYLHPIPTQELTLNPNFIQNPGWGS